MSIRNGMHACFHLHLFPQCCTLRMLYHVAPHLLAPLKVECSSVVLVAQRITLALFQISRSSGGTFSMLSISKRAPANSCWLGEYVPSDCRFLRAVISMKIKPIATRSAQPHTTGTAMASHGIRSL